MWNCKCGNTKIGLIGMKTTNADAAKTRLSM